MSRWTINRTAKGESLTWKCDNPRCKQTNLEKYKKCMTCFKGVRPERTEGEQVILRHSNTANDWGLDLTGEKKPWKQEQA